MKKIAYASLFIVLIFTLLGCNATPVKQSTMTPIVTSAPTTISNIQLEQIKNGWSYDKVSALVSGPGEFVADGAYKYKGDESLQGKDVQLMFEQGQVIMIVWGIK